MHASVGGVVFRGFRGVNNVTIGAVRALCPRCAKTPPHSPSTEQFDWSLMSQVVAKRAQDSTVGANTKVRWGLGVHW